MKENCPRVTSDQIKTSIGDVLKPWSKIARRNIPFDLPQIPIIQIARGANLSPERVLHELPNIINVDGSVFHVHPEPIGTTHVPIKKLIRESVKEPPIRGVKNGRNRLNEDVLGRKIRQEKGRRRKLIFTKVDPNNQDHAKDERRIKINAKKIARNSRENKVEIDTSKPCIKEISHSTLIQNATWTNLDRLRLQPNGAVNIAIELCPLYVSPTTLAGSKLIKDIKDDSTIESSRVGKKWLATLFTLEELANMFSDHNQTVVINATFADIGVFIDKNENQDPELVERHEQLYREALLKFCQRKGLILHFNKLSNIPPKNPRLSVPKFIVGGSNLNTVSESVSLVELLRILQIGEGEIFLGRKYDEALKDIFKICSGDIQVFRGLVRTYTNYPTTNGSNIHLGMERAPSLLILHRLLKTSAIANMPRLDIVVK